jgi:hypothetical protein
VTTTTTTTIITTSETFTDKILPYGLKGGFLIKQGKVVKNWKLRYFWYDPKEQRDFVLSARIMPTVFLLLLLLV